MKIKQDNKLFFSLLIVSLFFCFNLFVFAPFDTFFNNIYELSYGIVDIWWCFGLVFIIVFSLLLLLNFFLKDSIRAFLIKTLFGLSLALYLQGNFLNFDYGLLDGKYIEWEKFFSLGLLNTLIWVTVIAVSFLISHFKKDVMNNLFRYVSLIVLGIQVSALVVQLFTIKPNDNNSFYMSQEGKFTLSDKKNIVMFVLDTFDAKFFEEIIENNPEYKEKFKDFTFFPDTIGAYPTTKGAMPFILTGQWYDNSIPYNDYVNSAWNEADLWKLLKEHNYDIRFYSGFIGKGQNIIDNYVNVKPKVAYAKEANALLSISNFRFFPHFLKQFTLQETVAPKETKPITVDSKASNNIQVSNGDLDFYNELCNDGIDISPDANRFRLYHLLGSHMPHFLDENIELVNTGTNFIKQSMGVLNIVNEYLQKTKELDIYDNTMFLILADHGAGYAPESRPLLLVKKFGDINEFMQISDYPASFQDLHPAISSQITNGESEDTFFMSNFEKQRTRKYMYYAWDNSWAKAYLPRITEYNISGSLTSGYKSVKTGNVYMPGNARSNSYTDYEIGSEVTFGKNGTGSNYMENKLVIKNTEYLTWINEKEISIGLNLLNFENTDLEVELDIVGLFTDYVEQQYYVYAESQLIHSELFKTNTKKIKFIVPSECIKNNKLNLSFDFPCLTSLGALGLSNKDDSYAVAFYKMNIYETEKIKLDEKSFEIDFSETGNNENYLIGDWSVQEENHRWSSYSPGIKINLDASSDVSVEVWCGRLSPEIGNTSIYFNSKKITEVEFDENGTIKQFVLRKEDFVLGNQVIYFKTPNATSPMELGINMDSRVLGLGFTKLKFKRI